MGFFCILHFAHTNISCSGPEAKKAKFLAKGEALYEQGNFVKAKLELPEPLLPPLPFNSTISQVLPVP